MNRRLFLLGVVVAIISSCGRTVSNQSLQPLHSGWRAIANADLVVHGRIDLEAIDSVDERGFTIAEIDVESVLKGPPVTAVNLRYLASREGAILAQRADSNGVLADVVLFVTRANGQEYLAEPVNDAIVPYAGQSEAIRAEIAQQQMLARQQVLTSGSSGIPDHTLLDQLTETPRSMQQAFEALIGLDCDAVPTLISWLPDPRPLAVRQVEFENPNPTGFEGILHYTPEVVTDVLAIALSLITGEPLGFIHNGGSADERERVVAAWRTYNAYLGAGAIVCRGRE